MFDGWGRFGIIPFGQRMDSDHRIEPQVSLHWQPLRDLSLRAAYGEEARAPSIVELFADVTDSFPTVLDICSAGVSSSPVVQQRCRSGFGGVAPVPPSFVTGGLEGVRLGVLGGNPRLEPEHGHTASLGLHWSPQFARDLSLSLDWYNVRVRNQVSNRASQQVLEDCYVHGDVRACANIARDASGQLSFIFIGYQNTPDGTEVEGYDLGVQYALDTDLGRFGLHWQTAYTAYIGTLDQPRGGNRVGEYDGPGQAHHRIKSNFVGQWQRGDWSAALTARYLSGLDEPCFLPILNGRPELCSDLGAPGSVPGFYPNAKNHLDDTWYIDLEGAWDTPWDARITLGVRNVFDRDPPVSYTTANNFDPGYEVPGRFWHLGYTQRF